MKILIAGLGAVGTVFACMLKKAGHTVHALTKERYLDALCDRKIRVSGIWGEHEAMLDGIFASIGPIRSISFDLIILTVKSFDTGTAIEQVRPLVDRNALVLAAQNGYGNYEAVSEAVGRERTILARVIFGAKLRTNGESEVTVIADDVRIGQPHGAVAETRIREIADAINGSGIPAAFTDNIMAVLWDKILYNAALNPLGAILGCTYGQLTDHENSRLIMERIIDEIFLVTQAHGIVLNWKTPDAYRSHFFTKLVPPTARHYPSMYYDIKAGKRTEIDAMNGAIVRLAGEKGFAVPVNETITRIISVLEKLLFRPAATP